VIRLAGLARLGGRAVEAGRLWKGGRIVKKFLQIAQGLAFAACIYMAMAGLMAGRAFGDDGGTEFGVPDTPQCPNAYSAGTYIGCASPGAPCTDYNGNPNTCTPLSANCNCGPQ
jgi:hypothetical protein